MYYAYVLRSLQKNILYKGSTSNLELRLIQHNEGLVTFTKKYRPWILVYHEIFPTRGDALKREQFFKSGRGRHWLKQHIK